MNTYWAAGNTSVTYSAVCKLGNVHNGRTPRSQCLIHLADFSSTIWDCVVR